jgi:hypothetical protein
MGQLKNAARGKQHANNTQTYNEELTSEAKKSVESQNHRNSDLTGLSREPGLKCQNKNADNDPTLRIAQGEENKLLSGIQARLKPLDQEITS